MDEVDLKYYFCWKVRGGAWITQGPFNTEREASEARQRRKAADADYGNVFSAKSKQEADERCASGRIG